MTTNTTTNTTATTTNSNHQCNSGIDPKEALSILSAHGIAKVKAKKTNTKPSQSQAITPNHHPSHTTPKNGHGCEPHTCATTAKTDDRRTMGQTIDLFPSNNNDDDDDTKERNDGNTTSSSNPSSPNHNHNHNHNHTHTEERIQLLQTQTSTQLLRTLFQLQEERVGTYHRFDDGLDRVLQTGDLTQYPHLTLSITAAFAVLSGSINEMERVFRNRTIEPTNKTTNETKMGGGDDDGGDGGGFGYGKEIADYIRKLQNFERDKLNYTAALHLEKIRGRNEEVEREIALQNVDIRANTAATGDTDALGTSGEGGEGGGGSSGNERIAKLLQDSIVSLQAKVNQCVQGINEVLEELRYISIEMEEEWEEEGEEEQVEIK